MTVNYEDGDLSGRWNGTATIKQDTVFKRLMEEIIVQLAKSIFGAMSEADEQQLRQEVGVSNEPVTQSFTLTVTPVNESKVQYDLVFSYKDDEGKTIEHPTRGQYEYGELRFQFNDSHATAEFIGRLRDNKNLFGTFSVRLLKYFPGILSGDWVASRAE